MRIPLYVLLACAWAFTGCPGAGITVDDDTYYTDDDDDTTEGDDDDTTPADDDDDDDATPADDDDDDDATADDDDDTTEGPPGPPDHANIYIMYGYPSMLESASVDAYMAIAGGSFNGTYWSWSDATRSYTIHQNVEPSGFLTGVQDPDAIIVYAGHSNFGLGTSFAYVVLPGTVTLTQNSDDAATSQDWTATVSAGDTVRFPSDAPSAIDGWEAFTVDAITASSIDVSSNYQGSSCSGVANHAVDVANHSDIDYVHTIDDIFNLGSDHVAINYQYLHQEQAYPNFALSESDIVQAPMNYMVPGINVERFPNYQGIAPGDTFGVVTQDPWGNPYHYQDSHDGYYKTIVHGGSADMPANPQYEVSFIRSCNSGRYYGETFDRGVMFYATEDADYEIAIIYLFVKGIIEDKSYDEIVALMNAADPMYEYFNFNEYPTPPPPPPTCAAR
jgi:hypothetical protein